MAYPSGVRPAEVVVVLNSILMTINGPPSVTLPANCRKHNFQTNATVCAGPSFSYTWAVFQIELFAS
jgi:hypothetical protein